MGYCKKCIVIVICLLIVSRVFFESSLVLIVFVLSAFSYYFMVLVVIAASLVCILSTSIRFAVFVYCESLKSTGSYWDGYSSGKSLSETSSGGFLRAERSSNSTPRTILPRYSLIKSLVEGLFRLGATTAKGPSMKPFFEFNHYAIGGVMGHKHCLCLCPQLRLRGRTGVFRRREVYLLATLLWVSPSASSSRMATCTKRSSCRGAPLADPAPKGSAFPSSSSICSFFPSPMRGGYFFWGTRTCFPAAAKEHYCCRTSYVIASVYFFRQVDVYRSGRTCFPGRDCVRCHSRLWQGVQYAHCLFHGSHNVLCCASGNVLCPFFSLRGGPNVCCGVLSLRWREEVRAFQERFQDG